MCGIWLHFTKYGKKSSLSFGEICEAFMKIQNRGPDKSSFVYLERYGLFIGFHRLAIMDTSIKGDQPFTYETEDKIYFMICNGEIYNHKELEEKYNIKTVSGSDCEVLLHLWLRIGMDEMVKQLNSEYALCICELDKKTSEVKFHISRDHCGIRPLFVTGDENELVLSSELKGSPFLFKEKGYKVSQFKPRNHATISSFDENLYEDIKYTKYIDFDEIPTTIYDLNEIFPLINKTFRNSVKSRMMTNRPLGALLSGGLDSSLVCSIASEYCKEHGQTLKTFSIGMPGGTDEIYAKMVAKHIGSDHTHIDFTEKEFLEALDDVISLIESYDITSVRASTGQYLVSKWIKKNTDIVVLKIGDLSDELLNGYLYNFYAPNAESIHKETIRILNDIHYYDVLRADRGIAGSGLEARCPFSDISFIKLILSIDPKLRMPTYKGIEKWLLREAFSNDNLLPEEVLWRKKCAFSDGVSSEEKSWFEIIQDNANMLISDDEFTEAIKKYNHLKPVSKESLYFRRIFEKYYGTHEETADVIPYYWLPKWVETNEPSARTLKVYQETKDNCSIYYKK